MPAHVRFRLGVVTGDAATAALTAQITALHRQSGRLCRIGRVRSRNYYVVGGVELQQQLILLLKLNTRNQNERFAEPGPDLVIKVALFPRLRSGARVSGPERGFADLS